MARIRKTIVTENPITSKKIVWQIAIYIRLSKDDGNDESLSITNQRKILVEYVESLFQGEYVIVDIYVDDGKSGTDYERPGFQSMIHDVEVGKVNCIICKNLSRAFRNYSDQGYFLENFFTSHSTRFITLGDPKMDTYLNPEAVSGMEVPINGLMNDRFAYKTSSDIRRTFDSKRRNGEFIGAFAPYGYTKDPADKNALVTDLEASHVIRGIYQWFVYGDGTSNEGLSKGGISRKLNELGIPNPTMYKKKQGSKYCNPHAKRNDGLWMATSVSRILKNKMYIGSMVQGRQRVVSYKVHHRVNVPEDEWYQVKNTHEAIIPLDLFEKAQELCQKNTRIAPDKKENYLFSGFLQCSDCGMSMTRRASSGHVYYNCSTYKRKSKDKCTKHTMRLDTLEAAVLMAIQKQIEFVITLADVIAEVDKVPIAQTKFSRLEHLLKMRKEELAKTEHIVSALYVDWKNGDITRDQYRKMKVKFKAQEEQQQQQVGHIKEEIEALGKGISYDDPYLQGFLKHKNIKELSQGILMELVKVIYIHEGGEITIQFVFNDEYKRIVDFMENNTYTLTVVENQLS